METHPLSVRMKFQQLCGLFLLLLFHQTVSAGRLQLPADRIRSRPLDRLQYDGGMDGPVHSTRPLIGILSGVGDGQRGRSDYGQQHPGVSYIAASYVKFVESGGARAVPLLFNEPVESLRKKFSTINGLIFPGGGSSLDPGPYLDTATMLFEWAIQANDDGDYFPVYGVCLGLELLSVIIAKYNCLESFVAVKKPAPLIFVSNDAKSKSVFSWVPEDVIESLATQNLTLENHEFGLTPATFQSIQPLADFFEVLTVSPDENNKMYVSSLQGKNYPVTALMWHAEKNSFEWSYDTIPHSSAAIRLTQSVANYVVSEARKSRHAPASIAEEYDLLIYNYELSYTAKDPGSSFEQVYTLG